MKTKLLVAAMVLLFPITAFGQPIVTHYAHSLGGRGFDEGFGVGVDGAGNAYFIGDFRGSFDFDFGSGTTSLWSVAEDIYVVSYDPDGNIRFAFQLGNTFGISEAAGDIVVENGGRFYVTGSQPFNTIDYDPDPASSENRDGEFFIAGYDNTGGFRFAVTPEGVGGTPSGMGTAVALDGAGNVYGTGRFAGTIDFDPEPASSADLTSNGGSDVFVASYTTDGAFRYAFSLGGVGADDGFGIAADANGNVFVTGSYSDVVSFDPGDSDGDGDTVDRTASVDGELFFAGYSPSGEFMFVYTLGDRRSSGFDLAVDAANNVYLTGEFVGTYAFDPLDTNNDGDIEEFTSAGNGSAFLAGYAPDGEFRFLSVATGGTSTGSSLSVDPSSGTSFLTGTFSGTVDFDASAATGELSSGSGSDVFVVSYDDAGVYRGGFAFGGNGLNNGFGIDIDALGRTTVTGGFSGTTDFDPEPGSSADASSAGQFDLFMASYSYDPISLVQAPPPPPPPPPGCPDGLFIADFDSDQGVEGDKRDDDGEYVALEHSNGGMVSLDDCALVFLDGMKETSYFAMQLSGDLDAGDTHLVGNPGVAGVDQTFPDAKLQNGPDAIAVLDRSASSVPNGTHVLDVLSDVVAAVVYVSDDNIFGQVPAPAKRTADLLTMLRSAVGGEHVPTSYALEANYPNPFNPSTIIPFSLPEATHVTLEVFDATGRKVNTLIDRPIEAGTHHVDWNGRSVSGQSMPSGVYVYRIRADRFIQSRGMLLVK